MRIDIFSLKMRATHFNAIDRNNWMNLLVFCLSEILYASSSSYTTTKVSQKNTFFIKMPGILGSWYCTSNLLITCLPTKFCHSFHHELRVSPVVLSMWPCKNNFHIQVSVIYFFSNPTDKLKKTGTVNRWGTTNSKPPGPISIIWFSSSNCTVQDHNILSTAGDALSSNTIQNRFTLICMSNIHVWTMNCKLCEKFVVLEHQH